MLKVADIVRDIVLDSEIALSALSAGYLNLSAYAQTIHSLVERKTRKPVRQGTIVAALSRLAKQLTTRTSVIPKIVADNLVVKTGLVEVAFDRTKTNRERLRALQNNERFLSSDFFTITHGVSELSIITSEQELPTVLKQFQGQKPTLLIENLSSISVRFNEKYIQVPNVIFAMLRPLALRRVNIVEIVSTFTELTFIIAESDLQRSFLLLSKLFRH